MGGFPVPLIPAAGAPSNLPTPMFVGDADGLDANLVLSDMIEVFQAISQRKLQPAQVERLLINLYAYRESLVRNAIQYAGQQNLLAYASAPMLDYLGQLLGVTRLADEPAVTVLQFTLAATLATSYTIGAGTQVATIDGLVVFATDVPLTIPAGSTQGSVSATATQPGTGGNGYLVGQIASPLSGNVLIAGVTNTVVSSEGDTPETDEHLRTRIQAAPNRFSNAGPAGAYRFYALSADPSIVDVQVTTPVPGTVNVYVLVGPITVQPAPTPNVTGIPSPTLLATILGILSADTIRPLTDTVVVLAPTEVDYVITGTVTLYSDVDAGSVEAAVSAAAAAFALSLVGRLQRDIVPEEIIAALGSVRGVYRVVLSSPTYAVATPGQWANCTAINLTFVIGTERS